MLQRQIAFLLRPGTQERWRRLYQELAGPRREQWEALSQQAGITQIQVRLMQLQRSELLLLTLQAQNPQQILEMLATSRRPFDYWLRMQLQTLLGWNMQEVLDDLPENLIFVWPAEGKSGESEESHSNDCSSSRDG